MIRLRRVYKSFGATPAVRDVSVRFRPGTTVAVLGRAKAGKTTLLQLAAGRMQADSGVFESTSSVSWPVGNQRAFWRNVTYRQNIRAVSAMYHVSSAAILQRILRVMDIRPYLDREVRDTNRAMEVRFSYALCFAIRFDYYIIDEMMTPSDAYSRELLANFIEGERGRSGFIIATQRPDVAEKYADVAFTMRKGRLRAHDTVEDAIRTYTA